MELEWDEDKCQANVQKHGFDFDDTRRLDWDNATYLEDARVPYPERRFWALRRPRMAAFMW
jgi:uncharacterized DUF497 family protein